MNAPDNTKNLLDRSASLTEKQEHLVQHLIDSVIEFVDRRLGQNSVLSGKEKESAIAIARGPLSYWVAGLDVENMNTILALGIVGQKRVKVQRVVDELILWVQKQRKR